MPVATLSIPYDRWPLPDRILWEAACQPGDFLECGPASHLRERSRRTLVFGYSRWLRFVERTAPAALAEAPAARITQERLRAYTLEQSSTLSPSTVWNDVKALYDMIRFMVPAQDWTWIKKIKARLEHQAQAVSHRVPVVDSGRLLDLGLSLMDEAVERDNAESRASRLEYRDGLIIALLALRPLRRRTFAGLTIGKQLRRVGETWILVLAAEDMKNDRAAEYAIPDILLPYLDRYLEIIRPLLPKAGTHAGLWPSVQGVPMGSEAIYTIICKRTAAAFGDPVNPHAFRHCDATTIATHAPDKVHLIAPNLGHTDRGTGDRYYDMSTSLEAGRGHEKVMDDLRERLGVTDRSSRRK